VKPSRRQVLSAGAVALVAACTREPSPAPLEPDPDVALLQAAVAHEVALIDAYGRVLAAKPELVAQLAPLLGDHAAHLARLREDPRVPAPSPPASAGAPTTGSRPPPDTRLLRALEQRAAAAHATAATTASRDLAPLLASLAACEAVHLAVLP